MEMHDKGDRSILGGTSAIAFNANPNTGRQINDDTSTSDRSIGI
jgi:hypothetical protein